jgi:hypothetical protein
MILKLGIMKNCGSALLGICLLASVACADVCFTHTYTVDEFLLGTKQAELIISYADASMAVDKHTRFTGTWMKRFFGEEKQERFSTQFLLDEGRINEIDWQNRRLYLYDLGKLDQLQWFRQDPAYDQSLADHLKNRYTVKPPKLNLAIDPEEHLINGYPCRRLIAQLELETHDHLKDTISKTLVQQESWLSVEVRGYAEYLHFRHLLSDRLGIESERLGPLTYLLRYWNGSLEPIRGRLKDVTGYPVKTETVVTAHYTTDPGTDAATTIQKVLKKESALLSRVSSEMQDPGQFQIPDNFETIPVQ